MSEAPERVGVKRTKGYEHNWWGVLTDPFDEEGVEYVRADLPPTLPAALAVPEVAALVEWYEIALEALEGEGRADWAPMRAALRAVKAADNGTP